ncbi:hypothetical protein D3C87_407690 [compost metagenome]
MCQLSFGRKSSLQRIINEFYVRKPLQKCDSMTEMHIKASYLAQIIFPNGDIQFQNTL